MLEKDAAPAIPTLMELTHHNDPGVRLRALQSLLVIRSRDHKAVTKMLVEFAHDPEPDNRRKACDAMRSFLPLLSEQDLKALHVYGAFPGLERPGTGATNPAADRN